jgi:uncharacterized protein
MWRTFGLIATVYAGVVLLAWAFQHRLLYLPNMPGREWAATPAAIGLEFQDLRLETEDGVSISAWLVPASPDRGLVLFFHGNAGNISHRLESIEIFHRLGLSVLIVDYRGYGRSEGRPSESGTYRDARAAWRFTVDELGRAPGEIVVFGRSLGAAVAARLAASVPQPPAALIMESPFTSAPDLAQRVYPFLPARWLTRFDYAARDYVADVACPTLVIHSEHDEIVPFALGREVFDAAPEPKRFLSLSGGHNTGFLESLPAYTQGIDAFLSDVAALSRRESRGHREGPGPRPGAMRRL